jgi:arabinofuranosyltransferase
MDPSRDITGGGRGEGQRECSVEPLERLSVSTLDGIHQEGIEQDTHGRKSRPAAVDRLSSAAPKKGPSAGGTKNAHETQWHTARRAWLGDALAVGLLFAIVSGLGIGLIDDSYIFLRYAENFANGLGPVFNAGERVEGFSSPLWMAVLGAASLVFDMEQAAVWLGVVLAGVCLVTVARGLAFNGTCEDAGFRGVIAFGLATCPVFFFAAGSGMDSALFAAASTAALVSAVGDLRRGRMSGVTSGLLVASLLARSEGLILAGVAGAVFVARRRGVGALGWFVAAAAALHVGRFAYYGAWVPNTAYAKIAGGWSERAARGAGYLLDAGWIVVPLVLAAGAAVLFRRRMEMIRQERVLLLSGWIGAYLGYTVYVGGDNIPAFRFLLPVIPAGVWCAAELWAMFGAGARASWRRGALCFASVGVIAVNLMAYRQVSRGYFINMELARTWANVGRWIDEHTEADAVIATPVVGAMGYFGRRTTIDMLGLTDRAVARFGRVYAGGAHGHARYHTDYVLEREPEYVIYMSSGRFREPVYTRPERIHKPFGYALYDFAAAPRTQERYRYTVERMEDGTVIEMLRRREGETAAASREDRVTTAASPPWFEAESTQENP